jgi:cobalt-precorrin 5A hydrolase/precorrin-3B C17-methyltransferase
MAQSQVLWVGIGCRTGISSQSINIVVEQTLQKYQLDFNEIAGISTIDTKASAGALWEFCHQYNLPLKTFTAAILSTVAVPNPAKIVKEKVGASSVAEASAILAASEFAPIRVRLLIPKQIFRLSEHLSESKGAVTIAVAQAVNQNFSLLHRS